MVTYNRSLPARFDVPSQSENKSTLIGTTSQTIKFSQDVIVVEIVNFDNAATLFININGDAVDVAKDIPIFPKGFYAMDRLILKDTGFSLQSTKEGTDVRIVGHYTLSPEP